MIPALFDGFALPPAWADLVARSFARGAYPWHTLADRLAAKTGRRSIPIDVADLSRYGQAAAAVSEAPEPIGVVHLEDAHDHEHGPPVGPDELLALEGWIKHEHPTEGGDTAHLIAYRRRALGLAWYSGRITLEVSLLDEPDLAAEVLWAELAHMVDFFGMTGAQRRAIYAAFHADAVDPLADHGHGSPEDWFGDAISLDYWFQVGEALMGGFVLAFTDVRPQLGGFAHAATPAFAAAIREALVPTPPPPADVAPTPDVASDPPETAAYFGVDGSGVFHDSHRGVDREVEWASYADATAAGRRPCGVCRPRP